MSHSRRTVLALGGAGLAVAVTGCRLDVDGASRKPAEEARESPDVAAVATAAVQLEQAILRLREVAELPPAMTASLRMHEVHLARLRGVAPASIHPSSVPTTSPTTRRVGPAVRRGEEQLVHTFTGLAQRAESGDLARLLAAMAAGTQQRLNEWPAA